MKLYSILCFLFLMIIPSGSYSATTEELESEITEMTKQLEQMKDKMNELKTQEMFQDKRVEMVEEKVDEVDSKWSWLTIGGDYRFRVDSLKGSIHDYMQYNPAASFPAGPMTFFSAPVEGYNVKNDTVLFNRFRIKLDAQATEDITVKSRLSMYKIWGHGSMAPVQGNYFADRTMGSFDGNMGYVPQDNTLRVDYAFASMSNIMDTPLWFSIGRRVSTGGVPTNVRQNTKKVGTAGVAGQLIDYSFDGLTVGYAPKIEALPGAYAKFCYGRGYDSGFESDATGASNTEDTDFAGLFIDPIYTDNLNVELQYIRGSNIFDTLPDSGVSTNLGDVDMYGALINGTIENVGIGDLNLFVSGAMSRTNPNDNIREMPFFSMGGTPVNAGFGLLYDDSDPNTAGGQGNDAQTGTSIYVGARYDIKKTGTKIGAEYNQGSEYWITFTPAADDIWTGKLGTRGSVYEFYVIQELPQLPISSFGKAFIRLGYQHYAFKYTGSNNWIGEPKEIEDLTTSDPSGTQMLAPLKTAQDIYATFDVTF